MIKRKILFIIYSIYGGGSEKQMQNLLNNIDRNRFQPHLAVFKVTGKENEFVPKDIPIYDLSTKLRPASLFLIFKLMKLMKKIKPDKILSFLWSVNLITLISTYILKISDKVIISERTYLELSILRYRFVSLRSFLIKIFYPMANKIIAVSDSVSQNLIQKFKIPSDKISVIYNGININEIQSKKNEVLPAYCKKPYIIGIGGLRPEKNFSLLIKSFAIVSKKRTDLNLLILGEGYDRANLEKLVSQLNLKKQVFLPGIVSNPYPYLAQAEILILSSNYEGFPNVILESIACKVPVIATNCNSGISEILRDEKTGLLVDMFNEISMATAIEKLLENKHLKETLTINAYTEVLSNFNIEKTIKSYEEILQ